MSVKNLQKRRKASCGGYLEIYIKDDGEVLFNHLTKESAKILREITGDKQNLTNFYCG